MTQPLWISHRGYCASATENTAAAFEAAIDQGFTHLETDLRITADGHLVLAHDDDLTRVAGLPIKVTESRREQLESVRLLGGEPLLFFDQWLDRFDRWHWILDIKPEQGERTVQALLEWWQQPRAAGLLGQRARFLLWQPAQADAAACATRGDLYGDHCPVPPGRRRLSAGVAGAGGHRAGGHLFAPAQLGADAPAAPGRGGALPPSGRPGAGLPARNRAGCMLGIGGRCG